MSSPVAAAAATTAGVAATSSPKKKAKTVAKKPARAHPSTADMVDSAIQGLKERGGSSLPAIKKYLAANYKVDAEKLSHYIKKYLRSAVSSGKLIQTKGKGASGSFKLARKEAKKKTGESESKPAVRKPASVQKKASAPKKAAAAGGKKTEARKKTASSKKAKTMLQKVPKATKSTVAKKPRAPKPKKAVTPKVPKKAAPTRKK